VIRALVIRSRTIEKRSMTHVDVTWVFHLILTTVHGSSGHETSAMFAFAKSSIHSHGKRVVQRGDFLI